MGVTNREQQYNGKDIERILRTSESEIPLTLRVIYETRYSYSGLKSKLRQHSVNDEKFNRLYNYLVKEQLIDTGASNPDGSMSLTQKAKDVLKKRFDRLFP